MKKIHNPVVNLRYWLLIFLASIFGTNTGDYCVKLYRQMGDLANLSSFGLKHAGPLPFLILGFLFIYFLEKRDRHHHEVYFWSAIILIRTAATNIADALIGDLQMNFYLLVGVLSIALIYLALQWQARREAPILSFFVPDTTKMYWFSMLLAGVLGTVIGDEVWHIFGIANSAAVLTMLMGLLVYFGYRNILILTAMYWFGIVFARISGTAVGDWLAKSIDKGGAGFTLSTATMISGLAFIVIAMVWRSKNQLPPLDKQAASSVNH